MQYSVRISLYPLPSLSPPPSIHLFSLYNNDMLLLYSRYYHLPISPELRSKGRLSTPSPVFSLHPSATSQPLPQWWLHQLLCTPANVYGRVYANGYGTCLRLLCACLSTRMRIHVCTSVRGRAVELCSNCAKLRISVSDELRDLQYNCATSSLLSSPLLYPTSFHPFMPPRPKELQPRSRYMRRVCTVWRYICARVRTCTTNMIAHNAS